MKPVDPPDPRPPNTLTEVLESRDAILLTCHVCECQLPANIRQMIDKHGPDCSLENAVRRYDCFMCGTKGRFTVFRMQFR